MRKGLVALALAALLSATAQAGVKVLTPKLAFYPTRKAGRIARLVFETDKPGTFFFLVRDAGKNLARCLATGPVARGRHSVDWDGNDAAGKVVPVGTYTVSLATGIGWTLDKDFGFGGRIGKFAKEYTIADPRKTEVPLPGKPLAVSVGKTNYYKAENFDVAGPCYMLKDGKLILSPVSGATKGDKLRVEYYAPAYFQNPWDVAADPEAGVFVLLRWKEPGMRNYAGRILKLSPDGRSLDALFGANGIIPSFNPSQQILLAPEERRLYIAGSGVSSHGVGVYSLRSGAPLYTIGGWFGGSKDPACTYTPAGIGLGTGNKIYIARAVSGVRVYDRTKEKKAGYLYGGRAITRHSGYAPLVHTYWGPCVESAVAPGAFYLTSYGSDITKVLDTGKALKDLYRVVIKGSPVGMSLNRDTGLLFAALRTVAGQVAVVADDGGKLREVARLDDPDLGPTHAVEYVGGLLYVVEDGLSPSGGTLTAMKRAKVPPQGKNRVSRYKIAFEAETQVAAIERK